MLRNSSTVPYLFCQFLTHTYHFLIQEEEYRELLSISHAMEEQYGQFFDSVIPFECVELVLKQLMYEISLLEREPQWVPAHWVKELPPHHSQARRPARKKGTKKRA